MAVLAAIPAVISAAAASASTAAATAGVAATGAAGIEAASIPLAASAAAGSSWLGATSLGLTALGGVTGVLGQLQAGKASSAAAQYNSDVASQNAIQSKRNADLAGEAGEEKAAMVERDTRAKVGQIKSQQAASGLDVNSGSALDVRSSAAELGELDALTVRSNAAKEAYGYQVQGVGQEAQSNLDTFEAKNDETAGEVGAASTFLGAVGTGASNFYKYQLAGGFG